MSQRLSSPPRPGLIDVSTLVHRAVFVATPQRCRQSVALPTVYKPKVPLVFEVPQFEINIDKFLAISKKDFARNLSPSISTWKCYSDFRLSSNDQLKPKYHNPYFTSFTFLETKKQPKKDYSYKRCPNNASSSPPLIRIKNPHNRINAKLEIVSPARTHRQSPHQES